MNDFFIGCTSMAMPDARALFTPPEPPSNYKRPEAIAEFQERALESFLQKAASQAMTGGLLACHIEDARGVRQFSAGSTTPGEVSCELVKWVRSFGFEDYPYSVGAAFTPTKRLWGFEIDQMLRIVGLEVMRYGHAFGVAGSVPPLRFWYKNNGAYDPLDILLGSAERRTMGLTALCDYLNLDLDRSGIAPDDPHAHVNLARAARRLCLRTGLVYVKE